MVSRKAVAGLLVVYVVSMLAEQTDGFVPFFTQSDFRKMQLQEKERNKAGQKKSLPALQRREEEGFSERAAADVSDVKSIQLAVPVLGMWLTPRQLENHRDVLEKLLAELSQDTPDGTARRLISAAGVLPFPPLTSSSSPRYLYSSKGFSVMSAHFAECSDTPAALVFLTDRCRIRRESLLKLEYSTYVNEICKRD
ncbi:promotilin [Columba livia]|uniref:promotilin n=1 Tax=Columba livia TaxID=8932 RepID=UPI0031BAB717